MDPPSNPHAQFAELLLGFEQRLDWGLLGQAYCWEDGQDFFGREQLEALREAGLLFADDLAHALGAFQASAGRSLYVGPGVAELAPMLCERVILGRELAAVTLPGTEADELNRVLGELEGEHGLRLFSLVTDGFAALAGSRVDHAWVVSVLTDPEAFPALHDELYQRSGELATGRGKLSDDRRRAEELIQQVLEQLAPDALLSTTDEELPLFEAACRARAWRIEVPDRARLSPVVGDPVRHCRVQFAP